jgi:hypothetical protein
MQLLSYTPQAEQGNWIEQAKDLSLHKQYHRFPKQHVRTKYY